MNNQENAVATVSPPPISIFGKTKEVLKEVNIDLRIIVETYAFFMEQQAADPNFRIPNFRARIPSGGGKAFDIITGDDDLDTSVTNFAGVIFFSHATNALFSNVDDRMDKPPICQSPDGVRGIDFAGTKKKCEDCQYNQWGSDEKGGGGKQCKNMRRLYILADGCNIPLIMTVPPTSTGNWENYRSTLAIDRKVPADVVTEFSLGVEENAQGIKYSIVKFKAVGALNEATKEAVKQLSPKKDLEITDDDYYTGEQNEAQEMPINEANSEVVGEQQQNQVSPEKAEEKPVPQGPDF